MGCPYYIPLPLPRCEQRRTIDFLVHGIDLLALLSLELRAQVTSSICPKCAHSVFGQHPCLLPVNRFFRLSPAGQVMDFLPGEHLNVKEVHYNQHGLLLLQGKGIYRCGEGWAGWPSVAARRGQGRPNTLH